jgi:hypothetical protein
LKHYFGKAVWPDLIVSILVQEKSQSMPGAAAGAGQRHGLADEHDQHADEKGRLLTREVV